MSQAKLVDYWLEKASADLESGKANASAGRLSNAVRDAYFSCFHAFCAVLIQEGRSFRRHKEVRSALHRDFVRAGKIAVFWGKHFDWLFDNRQKADYRPLVEFELDQIEEILDKSQGFLNEMKRLLRMVTPDSSG